MRKSVIAFLGVFALFGCSGSPTADKPAAELAKDENNVLHITWGGIAKAEAGEVKHHWSNWTINLVDGSTNYGWTSDAAITFPHNLDFELAGNGMLSELVLDTRFEPVVREDGSASQSPGGSPIRKFAVLGSAKGPEGPFETLLEGEAKADARSKFALAKATRARWLRLRIDSNWAGKGITRLA